MRKLRNHWLTCFVHTLVQLAMVLPALAREQLQTVQVIDLGTTAADVQIVGAVTHAHLRTVAIGDFNGDGIPDVALGAPDTDVTVSASDVRPGAGVVYII